ncbi:MAG: hypothetical protein CMJ64_02770 [Planctomycetaceae bacterium]|nr:hypothetical protein [Planctomycetaceae bacterium]
MKEDPGGGETESGENGARPLSIMAILDVLAQDAEDRRYNIEMQTTLPVDLQNRLTFYGCLNYVRQLSSGSPYHHLRPAISICVLDRRLFG